MKDTPLSTEQNEKGKDKPEDEANIAEFSYCLLLGQNNQPSNPSFPYVSPLPTLNQKQRSLSHFPFILVGISSNLFGFLNFGSALDQTSQESKIIHHLLPMKMTTCHEQRRGSRGAQDPDGGHGGCERRGQDSSNANNTDANNTEANNTDTGHSRLGPTELLSTEGEKSVHSDQTLINMIESLRQKCDLTAFSKQLLLAAEDARRARQKLADSVGSLQEVLAEFAPDEAPSSNQDEPQQPRQQSTHDEEATALSPPINAPLDECQPGVVKRTDPTPLRPTPSMVGLYVPTPPSQRSKQAASGRIHVANQWGLCTSPYNPADFAHREEAIGSYYYPHFAPQPCDTGGPFGYLHHHHTAAAVIPPEYHYWLYPLARRSEGLKLENAAGSASSMVVGASPAPRARSSVARDPLLAHFARRRLSSNTIGSHGQPPAAERGLPGSFRWS
ncbi:hypothetical protein PG987_001548 [Apiospora arundinis]